MSVSVLVTNLSSARISIDDLYVNLDAAGSSTDHLTFTTDMVGLDAMEGLKAMVNAGTVSVAVTAGSSNNDLMSVPLEQHGSEVFSVASVAVLTTAVSFANDFVAAPKIIVSMEETAATSFKATPYIRSSAVDGFTLVLDVTSAETGAVTAEDPTMSPAENGVLLGPFTATLANTPLTSAVVTLHWEESAVAKTATITGTSTLGGADAANLSAATINRTTGALSITFAGGHPPDTGTITVDYTQVRTVTVNWMAVY